MSYYGTESKRVQSMFHHQTEPQIKSTLNSSSYLRNVREQSLQQAKNWDQIN
jgi:hypothetical protein